MPDCIVAAGGLSSRMKSWKPSLPWGRITMIEKVVGEALKAGCKVVVAGGFRYSDLQGLFRSSPLPEGLSLHFSPQWELGMDETVRSALNCISTDLFFIVPADMPLITAEDYRKLASLYEDEHHSVIRPVFSGKPGHPVLLDSSAAETLRRSTPGTAIRHVLTTLETATVSWDHGGVIRDIDTLELYKKFKPESF